MRKIQIATAVIALALILPLFQNCSKIEFSSKKDAASVARSGAEANGDGYTGMQVQYTKEISASQKADIFVSSGQGPYQFDVIDGGRGSLAVIDNTSTGAFAQYQAPPMVSPPYYATVRITDATGAFETIRVAVGFDGFTVLAPKAIKSGERDEIEIFGQHGLFSLTYDDGGRGRLDVMADTPTHAKYMYRSRAGISQAYVVTFKIVDRQGYEKTVTVTVNP